MQENISDESRPSTSGETSNGSSSEPKTNASNTTRHETTNDLEIMINLTNRRKSNIENEKDMGDNRLHSRVNHDEQHTPGKRRKIKPNLTIPIF